MNFEVIHVSRGDIRLKIDNKHLRVLGEALIASASTDPSYVIYLNSLNNWSIPQDVPLTECERKDVISAIKKYFDDRGSLVEFV